MIKLKESDIKSALSNVSINGTGTHLVCDCPFCGKSSHLYVQRATNKTNSRGQNVSWMFDCKKCSTNGTIYKLLKKLGKEDLLQFGKTIQHNQPLSPLLSVTVAEQIQTDVSIIKPPTGFTRVSRHPYLDQRGFTQDQYRQYVVGITRKLVHLKRYVIFLIMEAGKCRGYVARNTLGKSELDEYNRIAKINGTFKQLRYTNSTNTDFAKLLFGIDELKRTSTVILVEGVFDKATVDRHLNLFKSNRVKCLCTFGKKVSAAQIEKLRHAGVKNVYLLFDADAIASSKKAAYKLSRYFKVKVGYLKQGDPGDLEKSTLIRILRTAESPVDFNFKLL